MLERAPEAARMLAKNWTDQPMSGEVDVRTQRPTASRRRIDLELEFREPATARTTLVWVEVKRDSGPSGEGQLLNYGCDLEERIACGEISGAHVVYLTRPDDWSEIVAAYRENEPDGVELFEATWPQTSAALARWARGSSDAPFSQRLVEEFVDYLEEEQVASTGLNLDDAIVLQRFEGTDEAFSTLLELTASELDRWPQVVEHDRHPKGRRFTGGRWEGCHRTYIPAGVDQGWGDDAKVLEWNFGRRRAGGPMRSCFAAGLTWLGPRDAVPWPATQGWPTAFETYDDGFPRLYRWLQPEELAARGLLDEQAAHLTKWIKQSFELAMDPGAAEPASPTA